MHAEFDGWVTNHRLVSDKNAVEEHVGDLWAVVGHGEPYEVVERAEPLKADNPLPDAFDSDPNASLFRIIARNLTDKIRTLSRDSEQKPSSEVVQIETGQIPAYRPTHRHESGLDLRGGWRVEMTAIRSVNTPPQAPTRTSLRCTQRCTAPTERRIRPSPRGDLPRDRA